MAYRIDFSESQWIWRRRRKVFLRLLLATAVAGAAWGVYDVYSTYNQPTLNMKLAEYEAVARPIEEMNAAWDVAAKEYGAMMRYYRLLWATSPTNFLSAMASGGASRVGHGLHPLRWTLSTGGECRLDYVYVFSPGDKAEQTKGLAAGIVGAVTSAVQVVGGKVDVQGIQHENLLAVSELNVTARFSLPDVRSFPAKEKTLADCVAEIAAMRRKVQDAAVSKVKDARNVPSNAKGMMLAYLQMGKDKPDFPDFSSVISVSGWFDRADQFIAKNKIPVDAAARRRIRAAWDTVGNARFPWDRFRNLDNDALVARTKAFKTVSDGVKRFRTFLEQRRVDCRRKLEPFVDAYERNDVFNEPLVESDLKGRVAGPTGIARVRVTFRDEEGVEPAILDKADEKFTFTWVHWELALGDVAGRDGERAGGNAGEPQSPADAGPLTLARLADCARRVIELGPGYAIDRIRVYFSVDGNVGGAVLEGLLPVKRSESAKGATGDVD